MPKQNPYIIPQEVNKKPFETIYELRNEYKVPSYEEFMKTYENGTNYADLEGGDISAGGSYGPGNSQSNQVASTIGGFVLSIT